MTTKRQTLITIAAANEKMARKSGQEEADRSTRRGYPTRVVGVESRKIRLISTSNGPLHHSGERFSQDTTVFSPVIEWEEN